MIFIRKKNKINKQNELV